MSLLLLIVIKYSNNWILIQLTSDRDDDKFMYLMIIVIMHW